jgi:YD repeat-containing protein
MEHPQNVSTASRLVRRITIPTSSSGPVITNTFDTVGRLLSTQMRNGGTIFNSHSYGLNAAHQRTNQTRPDNSFVEYSYDPAGQLRTASAYLTQGGSLDLNEQLRYGYDPAQRMIKRTNWRRS